MIRVALPYHLRTLARVDKEVELDVPEPVTLQAVLDVLEAEYPMLQGAVRTHGTQKRRAFIRYFACGQDLSHQSPDVLLPKEVVQGTAPFQIVGAMAGG